MNAITQRSVAYYVQLTNQVIPVRYKFKRIAVREFTDEPYFRVEDSTAFISVKTFDEREIFQLVFDYCKIPLYV